MTARTTLVVLGTVVLAIPILTIMLAVSYGKVRLAPGLVFSIGWQATVLSVVTILDEAGWLP